MIIKEYRIVMPLTVPEYKIGQLYSTSEASKNETGGGEGLEVIKNEPFDNVSLLGGKYTTGQYTYKIYHLETKAPAFIRLITPKGALELHEESWNSFPYCRTVITNPSYMKENFLLIVESMHVQGINTESNILQIPENKLKDRQVIVIDISEPVEPRDYKPDEDPSTFKSKKTGRGPLIKGEWMKGDNMPFMTCYKLVTIECKWLGLQRRLENIIQKSEQRLFRIFHRQIFCWIDNWINLTVDDIRRIEEATRDELDRQRFTGPVRGLRGGSGSSTQLSTNGSNRSSASSRVSDSRVSEGSHLRRLFR